MIKKNIYIMFLLLATCFSLTSCKKENTAIGEISPMVSVDYIRNLYNGDDITLNPELLMGAHQIACVVISDAKAGNINPGELVVQNEANGVIAGMVIDFGAAQLDHVLPGDSVKISVDKTILTRKNGRLLITGADVNQIQVVSSNQVARVRVISVSELYSNFIKYESTLIKINNASIDPIPVGGEAFIGNKLIDDGTGGDVKLNTLATANFASKSLPMNASFVGIATFFNENKNTYFGAKHYLRLRNDDDVTNASGALYIGFPETFESPDKSLKAVYDMVATDNNIQLSTGNWKLYQTILAGTVNSDRYNPFGKQCVRMERNLTVPALVQMNFDLPNGASKVTVNYGSYSTDPSSSWALEYSQDAGLTWTQAGDIISNAANKAQTATFNLNLTGNVRFRINKLGLGTSNPPFLLNGILNIDDVSVYQNAD
jgi:predicted small secreted protein